MRWHLIIKKMQVYYLETVIMLKTYFKPVYTKYIKYIIFV